MEEKISVRMNGKEFLALKKFEHDKKKERKPLSKYAQGWLIIGLSLLVGSLMIAGILGWASPSVSSGPDPGGIILVCLLVLSVGLSAGWAFHGPGFWLFKVTR